MVKLRFSPPLPAIEAEPRSDEPQGTSERGLNSSRYQQLQQLSEIFKLCDLP